MSTSSSDRDLLAGSDDWVDRIVLNAYFPRGRNPGGVRGVVAALASGRGHRPGP
jgi:hypothetical protein